MALVVHRVVSIKLLIKEYYHDAVNVIEQDEATSLLSRMLFADDLYSHGLLNASIHFLQNIGRYILALLSVHVTTSNKISAIISVMGIIINDILGVIFIRSIASALYSFRHSSVAEVKAYLIQTLYEFAHCICS